MTSEDELEFRARPIVAGDANGRALVFEQGLSFAMGVDVNSGHVSDRHSGHAGTSISGRVLVMPTGRGSSSASTALAEAIRLGTAPAAIMLGEIDQILAVGAIAARTLYGRTCPIVVAAREDMAAIRSGDELTLQSDGRIVRQRATINRSQEGADEPTGTHRP